MTGTGTATVTSASAECPGTSAWTRRKASAGADPRTAAARRGRHRPRGAARTGTAAREAPTDRAGAEVEVGHKNLKGKKDGVQHLQKKKCKENYNGALKYSNRGQWMV